MRMATLATLVAGVLAAFGLMLPAARAERVGPLPFEACAALRLNLESRLGADAGFRIAQLSAAAEHRKAFGFDGRRCLLWAQLPGVTRTLDGRRPVRDLAGDLATAFLALGWTAEDAFAADGPDGTAFAHSNRADLCLSSVEHTDHRPADATGPAAPWERGYFVEISCYRRP